MEISPYALLPLVIVGIWLFTAYTSTSFPMLSNRRICLLIAHPDDEAMFFSPAVWALTQPHLGNHLKILCLSSGNADGLGHIRKTELVKSGLLLGLRKGSDVLVLDDPKFPDSMTANWDTTAIAELLGGTFAPQANGTGKKGKTDSAIEKGPVKANIDVLVTFDQQGVSSHPNHISLYHGAVAFVKSLSQDRSGWEAPVKLYTLPSVNVFRKYASILDVPATVLSSLLSRKKGGEYPNPLLFVSGIGGYRTAQKAMTTAHKSQMRWFRWGWIGISRYMVVNDLRRYAGT